MLSLIPNLQAYVTLILGAQVLGWAAWSWGNIPVELLLPRQQKLLLNPLYSVFTGVSAAAGVLLGIMWAAITNEFAWGGVMVLDAGLLTYATVRLQAQLEAVDQTS